MAKEVEILKVANKSSVNGVAGSITKILEMGKIAEVHVIGAGALNQAYKASARASGNLAMTGKSLVIRPGFGGIEIDGDERTFLKMIIDVL